MKRLFRPFVLLGLAAAAACSDTTLTAPDAPLPELDRSAQTGDRKPGGRVSVMTQNLYVGADLDAVIGALATPDPADDVPSLLTAITTLGLTDFPARARGIAGTIARLRPHAIGLQEVSLIDLDLTGLGLPVVMHLDFLATLNAELAARGLHYTVAARIKNITAAPFPGIQLVDYDVLMVDAERVTVRSAQARNFTSNLGVVAPGIDLTRGWVSAELTIDGEKLTVVSTHLESGNAPGLPQLRAAQARELMSAFPGGRTTLLLGDLNDVPGSPMTEVLQRGRFIDAWRSLRPGQTGFTCCEAADLSNPVPTLVQRLDYVWVRSAGHWSGEIRRVGIEADERVTGPAGKIWPSDHSGLVALLR